jgi:hypothetical protein
MLTEIYVEVLLVDEEAWDVREINEMAACVARWPVAVEYLQRV